MCCDLVTHYFGGGLKWWHSYNLNCNEVEQSVSKHEVATFCEMKIDWILAEAVVIGAILLFGFVTMVFTLFSLLQT